MKPSMAGSIPRIWTVFYWYPWDRKDKKDSHNSGRSHTCNLTPPELTSHTLFVEGDVMNILEEFWYGNIEPAEYDTSSGKEYKEKEVTVKLGAKSVLSDIETSENK